jgi:2,4-dienoyl-CoA reductase-like NADH-dependent reductase (Old Yellow Enzyme family)
MADSSSISINELGQPIRFLNGHELRNRLAKAATSETLGTYDNRPTSKIVRLYRRWAASGVGLLITGNVINQQAIMKMMNSMSGNS